MKAYVRIVDGMNRRVGRVAMYMLFGMMGVLLWSSISKTFFFPSLWTLEMAQFAMVAYYIMGGPYSIQLGSNVRMDLFYGSWSDKKKAQVDAITVLFLLFTVVLLLLTILLLSDFGANSLFGERLKTEFLRGCSDYEELSICDELPSS
mgnify:CR=1 FL=1